MRFVAIWILSASTAAAAQPEQDLRRFEFTGTEMATSVKIVLYASDEAAAHAASTAAFARIRGLTGVFSDYDPQSELLRLCESASGGGEVPASDDLWRILARAGEISRASDGAFDVTVGPVVRLWRRARKLHELPDPQRLEEARGLVGHQLLRLDPARRTVRLLRPGMRLDLGGIAKGSAADDALQVLRERGLPSALVDIGGEVALGAPPPGRPGWRIGIAAHEGEERPCPDLWLSNVSVATSGDSEQFVVIGGRRYSHILDPRTGVGLTDHSTVTIVAPDGTTADALATAVSVLGPAAGLKLMERFPGAACRMVHLGAGGTRIHESARWSGLRRIDEAPAALIEGGTDLAAVGSDRYLVHGIRAIAAPPTAAGGEAPAGGGPQGESKDGPAAGNGAGKKPDPTVTPPVEWMLEPTPLPAASAEGEKDMKPYSERIPGSSVAFDMVPIPGGKFLLGSPNGEEGRSADEGPQVEVELEPFWMGAREVRWEEYELWGLGYDALRKERTQEEATARDLLADTISRPTKPYCDMTFNMGRDGYPAICMTQLAAKVYCKWLSAKTGRYYRLPTEAEWEYACRAGTATAYSFGSDPKALGEYAWFFANSADKYHKVGEKKPNPWGLFDMHGNVAEWVLDQHTPEGYKALAGKPCRSPVTVPEAIYPRVVRSGSWMDDPERLRCAARKGSSFSWMMGDPQMPKSIWYHTDAKFVGFRVVRPLRTPTPQEASRFDIDQSQREEMTDYLEYLKYRK